MTRQVDIMILGGGIAGLGAALKARELGREYTIFESQERAGGLLDNFTIDGFRFDNAVHLSFATEPKVREIFDKVDYYTHPAEGWNFDNDKWLKHPIQNNLFSLSPNEKVEMIKSFLERPEVVGDDYDSWLRHQYGNVIAERYPIKYTKKYWGTDASKLSTTWIGNRMRRASLDEILFGAFVAKTPNTYYTKEMRYPKVGGYRAFIEPLISQSKIEYKHRATEVDPLQKVVKFSNGESIEYIKLISSIPLPNLSEMTVNIPEDVSKAAKSLEATSIDLISVGFNKIVTKYLWFYIYDEEILASRAYSPSMKSPNNAPIGCSSLQFEIYSRGTSSKFKIKELKDNVVYALSKMGIAEKDDILFLNHKHLPFGNVIFDKGMESQRDLVRNYYSNQGIATVGRFGEWDYLWSNQSLLSGYTSI